MKQSELKSRICLCEDQPIRTTALEQRIQIGTGFHNKWYRSQKEHWIGWITVKEYQAIVQGKDPEEIMAKTRWNSLNCLPMMFWFAEVSGLSTELLTQAEHTSSEAAKRKSSDCTEHGGAMRKVISWDQLIPKLQELPEAATDQVKALTYVAYDHLVLKSKNSAKYRRLREEAKMMQGS